MRVSEKTTENSERIDQQARSGIESGTYVYQLWAQNRSATGKAMEKGQVSTYSNTTK